jgi:methionine-rich copper-binding protein CopC
VSPTPTPARRRRHGRILARSGSLAAAGLLVAGGSVLGLAAPAQAHNYLVSSTPSAGQTLTQLPESFEITTNEPLLESAGLGGFALEIVDADGLYYGDGCLTVSGPTMSAAPAIGAAGQYTLLWQVVSADGHTVSEEFPFTWAPADDSAAGAASTGSATAPDCDGTTGGEPSGAAGGTDSPAEPAAASEANLADVLWIGGAVLAVGLAIGVTLFVVGRRRP